MHDFFERNPVEYISWTFAFEVIDACTTEKGHRRYELALISVKDYDLLLDEECSRPLPAESFLWAELLSRKVYWIPYVNTSVAPIEYTASNEKKLHSEEFISKYIKAFLSLSWQEFEAGLMRIILSGLGFQNLEHTGRPGDANRDWRGRLFIARLFPINVIVQAKRWRENLGIDEIQRMKGTSDNPTNELTMIVTCGKISKPARHEAKKKGVQIIDGSLLARICFECGLDPSEVASIEVTDHLISGEPDPTLVALNIGDSVNTPPGTDRESIDILRKLFENIDKLDPAMLVTSDYVYINLKNVLDELRKIRIFPKVSHLNDPEIFRKTLISDGILDKGQKSEGRKTVKRKDGQTYRPYMYKIAKQRLLKWGIEVPS
ncbi:MAG: restriction endonuclease [Planctomycetes bacterium]|nr:restriction endonuclease [Planctomycetota bacterium]